MDLRINKIMKKDKKLNNLLKENNAILVRDGSHQIWRLPNGRSLTVSKNRAGDKNIEKNNIKLLQKLIVT